MKVKKFIAASMPEIMKKIRADLGSDAVILHSKEIRRGGFLGLFKKKMIEVVAALDPQPIMKQEQPRSLPNHVPLPNHSQERRIDDNAEVLNEIKYLKKILEHQAKQSDHGYLPDYQFIYQYLLSQEVEDQLAKELIDSVIRKHEDGSQSLTPEIALTQLREVLGERLRDVSFKGITYDRQVVQFAGPTGVGKTTTLAKIAANCILVDRKKVAFITTDTYRIAAIDQLKTYAKILDVPIEVAYTIKDYREAIEKFSIYDIILVDTAGRNFRDEQYIADLQKNIGSDTKTYLVLSLTAKPNDIIDIYKQFQHLSIEEIIFTKLDETMQFGSLINIVLNNKVGIAYLTNGQAVPDDILTPTPKIITDYILAGYSNE